MITVKQLREAVAEIVAQIPEIRTSKFVFNESQLTDKLSKHRVVDNAILLTVCPSYQGFDGTDEDVSGYVTYFQFFILSKIDNKTIDEADVVAELQPLVHSFLAQFRLHGSGECVTFGNVEQGSLKIDPIINLSQCCGWVITMNDSTYADFAGYTE